MNKPAIGNVYESRDSRRPKRIRVIKLWATTVDCETKNPGDRHYGKITTISRDRLNGKCHWKLVRRAK